MSEPIVFISHHRIKPGKAEAVKPLTAEIWSAMEKEKPRSLMNLAYVNEEATEATSCTPSPTSRPCSPLAGSGRAQPPGIRVHRTDRLRDLRIGDQIVEGMEADAASAGATLTLWPEFVTGFLRLAPG